MWILWLQAWVLKFLLFLCSETMTQTALHTQSAEHKPFEEKLKLNFLGKLFNLKSLLIKGYQILKSRSHLIIESTIGNSHGLFLLFWKWANKFAKANSMESLWIIFELRIHCININCAWHCCNTDVTFKFFCFGSKNLRCNLKGGNQLPRRKH